MARLREKELIIDVSEHNGEINWERVKESGVKGAIIRTTWGSEGVDKQAIRNIEECIRLDIPFGVYHYSYTGDGVENIPEDRRLDYLVGQVYEEAESFITTIAPYEHKMTYPAFMDVEDDSRSKYLGQLTQRELNIVCNCFLRYVENYGFIGGLYANRNWFENKLNYSNWQDSYNGWSLEDIRGIFRLWVAEFGENTGEPTWEKTNFGMYHDIWQYSSRGRVDGIAGYVDVNYVYEDYPKFKENSGAQGGWTENLNMQEGKKGWIKFDKFNTYTRRIAYKCPYWIYRDEDGSIRRGWLASGNKWYFLTGATGIMTVGLQQINSDVYFFDYENGDMKRNTWLMLDGTLYFIKQSGKLAVGNPITRLKINGKQYIFGPNGQPANTQDPMLVPYDSEYFSDGVEYEVMVSDEILTVTRPEKTGEMVSEAEEKPVRTYKVSYIYEGDIPEGIAVPISREYQAGQKVIVNMIPEYNMEEYEFKGWYKDGLIATSFVMPEKEVILKGIFTKIVKEEVKPEPPVRKFYNVSFEYKGDIPENAPALPGALQYLEGTSVILKIDAPICPEGYEVTGWTSDYGIKNGGDNVSFIMPNHNFVIYCTWTEIKEEELPVDDEVEEVVGVLQKIINFLKKLISLILRK